MISIIAQFIFLTGLGPRWQKPSVYNHTKYMYILLWIKKRGTIYSAMKFSNKRHKARGNCLRGTLHLPYSKTLPTVTNYNVVCKRRFLATHSGPWQTSAHVIQLYISACLDIFYEEGIQKCCVFLYSRCM